MTVTHLVIFGYLAAVFSIGPLSQLFAVKGSREDFFLATRTIGPFLLLMSLFGTHMSAFSLLGATGEGYARGIGTFGLMASSSALVAPLAFYFIGTRVWQVGKNHGYVTQCQYFRERWDSDLVGLVLFVLMVLLLIPYLLIGVLGGGIVFKGIVGFQNVGSGSLLVVAVTLGYVAIGGLRGTAWANTFQTLAFMIIGVLSFVAIVNNLGQSASFLENLRLLASQVMEREDLQSRFSRAETSPYAFFSYMFIPLSVAMFPHVTMHWLTARSVSTFKMVIVFYPICILCVWLPTVLIGAFASAHLDLPASKANEVLVELIKQIDSPWLTGMLAAGVLAAVMSTLDSQTLSLSEMFTTDIVNHYGGHDRLSERVQITLSRIFVALILGITWYVSLGGPGRVFIIGTWCFAGFSALTPIMIAALYWRRSTKWGVLASALTTAALGIYFFQDASRSGQPLANYKPLGLEVQPVVILLAASIVALVAVSLITPRPKAEVIHKFFSEKQ